MTNLDERVRAPDDVVRAVQKYVNTDFAAEERQAWLRAMQRPTLYGRISKFFRRIAGLEDL